MAYREVQQTRGRPSHWQCPERQARGAPATLRNCAVCGRHITETCTQAALSEEDAARGPRPLRAAQLDASLHSHKLILRIRKHHTRDSEARRGLRGASDAMLRAALSQSGTTWRRRELAWRPPSWSRSPGRPLSPGGARPRRQSAAADDIPVFDRNKVSLDLPGSLFGPSVSLLIRTTKIIGDVIQNSAVRYQTFLRLFRPLFRGPFEIKGLDPPTTTTSTTTARPTSTPDSAAAADNEVRRR